MPNFHDWPSYIIRRGIFLSALLLCAELVLLVWADARPWALLPLRHQMAALRDSSLIVLGACLLGGVLLEDGPRKSR